MYKHFVSIIKGSIIIIAVTLAVILGTLGVSKSGKEVPLFSYAENVNIQDTDAAEGQQGSTDSKNTTPTIFRLNDNTGYYMAGSPLGNAAQSPLKNSFVNISINAESSFDRTNTETDRIGAWVENGRYYNKPAFGVSGSAVYIGLNYNFDKLSSFSSAGLGKPSNATYKGTLNFSEDTATSVGGIDVGTIDYGALVIQKKVGDASDYEFVTSDGESLESLHTVDFTTYFAPQDYYGVGNKLRLYTPSGEDLNRGVFYKISFAYELKYSYTWHESGTIWDWNGKDHTETVYINMLETFEFYVVQNSGVVTFQNASNSEDVGQEGTSEAYKNAGTIVTGHTSFSGFRLNTLGSESYTITYTINGAGVGNAVNGQFFDRQGRYDFTVKTKLGKERKYTIFIDRREINDAIWEYFDENLITPESYKIYTTSELPTYLAEKTFYKLNSMDNKFAKAYGRIYKEPENEAEDRILIAEVNEDKPTGTITQAGYYTADFYTDYAAYCQAFGIKTSDNPSGDSYHFTFRFEVVGKDTPHSPFINEQYVTSYIAVADLQAKYYGVTFQSAGVGKVTFAFSDYSGAYNFIYNVERGKAIKSGSNYIYNGTPYTSQSDCLAEIDKVANSQIKLKYFDASNNLTYLTANMSGEEVLTYEFSQDIVVFLNDAEQEYATDSDYFLNDRKYSYLSLDGSVKNGTVPVAFLNIGEFETSSVLLINKADPTLTYGIEYGVSVEQQLQGYGAASGVYIVRETNKYDVYNEYEVKYIIKGDMTGEANFSIFRNNKLTPLTAVTNDNNGQTIFANGFVLHNLINALDKHSIVKITYGGETEVYEFNEINDMIFEQAGEYNFIFVDRLGNTFKYNIVIDTAVGYGEIVFETADENVQNIYAFVGQTIDLPTPTVAVGYEFMGWQYGEIFITVGGSFTLTADMDIEFTEVLHFINTAIDLYDGDKIETKEAKPDDKVLLPFLTRDDIIFEGWLEQKQDGSFKIYYGQITALENINNLRLDAIWTDGTTVSVTGGETLTTPILEGYEFVGWFERITAHGGYIWISGATIPADTSIQLEALWRALPAQQTQTQQSGAFAGLISFGKNITSDLATAWDNGLGVVVVALLVVLILGLAVLKNKLKIVHFITKQKCKKQEAVINYNAYCDTETKIKKSFKFKPKHIILATSLLLAVVIGSIGLFGRLPAGIFSKDKTEQNTTAAQTINETAFNTLTDTWSNIVATAPHTTKEEVRNLGTMSGDKQNEQEIGEDENFLYACVALDLIGLGYSVFPSIAVTSNNREIRGLGYTDYEDGFTQDGSEKIYFGVGFITSYGEIVPTLSEITEGIELLMLDDNGDIAADEGFGFLLSFSETYEKPCHYIANDKYVTYQLINYAIDYTIQENIETNYNLDLGLLYDYDNDVNVYDPDLGKEYSITGTSINTFLAPDIAKGEYEKYIQQQTANGFTVETCSFTFVSMEALEAYILGEQSEDFLGITVDEIRDMEKTLGANEYYAVDGYGSLVKLEIPPPPPEESSAGFWTRALGAVVAVGVVCVGVVIIAAVSVVSCGAATAAAPYIMAAFIGMGVEIFMQTVIEGKTLSEVNYLKVAIAGVSGMLCAIPGVGWLGAGLIQGGTEMAMKWAEGGSLEEILLAGLIGFGTGVAIHGLGKALSKVKFCFPAGTGVLLASGAVIEIENIKVGDRVKTYNQNTGLIEYKTVTETFTSTQTEQIRVTTSDGQEVVSSINHPYYVNGYYIEAQQLRAGDMLRTVNGEKVIVEQVSHEILESPITMYNFEVADNSNYFVTTGDNSDNAVLVHNSCQKHHTVTNKMKKALADTKNMTNVSRNKSSIFEALNEQAHKGYQAWHIDYDKQMVKWIEDNADNGTVGMLQKELQKIYDTPEMQEKFGKQIVKILENLLK